MTCQVCGGTGYVVVERGGLSGARQCDCVRREIAENRIPRAGIPEKYARVGFENFRIPPDNPVTRPLLSSALLAAKKYAVDWIPGQKRNSLLLLGDHGSGKTHLAVSAFKALIGKGFDGVFFDYQNLLDMIQSSWNPEAGLAERATYSRAMETPFLLLDDLGARRSIEWVEDTVTAIITYRYNNNLPLIATSNLPVEHTHAGQTPGGSFRPAKTLAEVIGMRSVSRLTEMCRVVNLFGVPDYRESIRE
jgi:DNA replication protein DnaC